MGVFSNFPELKGTMYLNEEKRDAAEKRVLEQRKQKEEEARAALERLSATENDPEAVRRQKEEADRARDEKAARLMAQARERALRQEKEAEILKLTLKMKEEEVHQRAEQAKEAGKAAEESWHQRRIAAMKEEEERKAKNMPSPLTHPKKPQVSLMDKVKQKQAELEKQAEKRTLKLMLMEGKLEVTGRDANGHFILYNNETGQTSTLDPASLEP